MVTALFPVLIPLLFGQHGCRHGARLGPHLGAPVRLGVELKALQLLPPRLGIGGGMRLKTDIRPLRRLGQDAEAGTLWRQVAQRVLLD